MIFLVVIAFTVTNKKKATTIIPDNIKLEFVEKSEFELNEQINPELLIKYIDNVAIIKYPSVDSGKVGEQYLNYIGRSSNNTEYQFVKRINIVDNQKPILELKEKSVILDSGSQIDYNSFIANYDDNSGKNNVDIKIENELNNTTVPGEYKVRYYATDKSNNVVSRELIIKINESIKPILSNEEKQKEMKEKEDAEKKTHPVQPQPEKKEERKPASTLTARYFYAKDYSNNIQNSFNACKSYLDIVDRGECTPFKNASGNWEGVKYDPNT